MLRVFPTLVTTAVAASAATAQHRPVAEFEVAGVQLGATPAEVQTGLLKAGFRVTGTAPIQSFDQDVRREAGRRRGRQTPWAKSDGILNVTAAGPNQEWAQVEFAQTPTGSRARSVTVQIPGEATTTEAFRRQVLSKFGQPDRIRNQGAEMHWCAPEALPVCGVTFVGRGGRDDAHPKLTASGTGGFRLALKSGSLAEQAIARDREAAVQRLAPKVSEAAF